MKVAISLACFALTFLAVGAEAEPIEERCEVTPSQEPASSPSLLQVQAIDGSRNDNLYEQDAKQCSYQLVGDQDGSQPCASLKGKNYKSGREAPLDEAGYQQTAALCCHHEMSLFVRREIKNQGFDVCDLSDFHGFVHWYDCSNDLKTFAEMKEEIAGIMASACPWLGRLPYCPKKDPVHCGVIAKCPATFPAGSLAGSSAPLSQAGYQGVAARCCHSEMAQFIRRQIERLNFKVCDEGGFNGFLHWFDCTSDDQTYKELIEGLVIARSGLPPMCPWLGSVGQACPPKGHNCPVVEVPEPAAHRRRQACR